MIKEQFQLFPDGQLPYILDFLFLACNFFHILLGPTRNTANQMYSTNISFNSNITSFLTNRFPLPNIIFNHFLITVVYPVCVGVLWFIEINASQQYTAESICFALLFQECACFRRHYEKQFILYGLHKKDLIIFLSNYSEKQTILITPSLK